MKKRQFHHKDMLKNHQSAFSLIELMTVVSIIAILTAIATPGLRIVMLNAQQAAAMGNARSIGLGLRVFAQDNGGAFPNYNEEEDGAITSSNQAFRQLLPDYIDSERVFSVKRSAWGNNADGRIDELEDRLRPGENHFAYVSGLVDTARTDWPLVVDGTDGTGKYSENYGTKGGCWEGRKGIIVTIGGSAQVVKLEGEGEQKYLPRHDYEDKNALDVNSYMGANAQLLDPE